MEKIFVLGVGAQKTGTTWLYDWLNSQKDCNMGALKEYHVWDGKNLPVCAGYNTKKNIKITKRLQFLAAWKFGSIHHRSDFLRTVMQHNTKNYFQYFDDILSEPETRLTGDITPSYIGLSEATLSEIRTGLKERDIAPRVTLFLRDPVNRCMSAAKDKAKRTLKKGFGENEVISILSEEYKSEAFKMRTNYSCAIKNLYNVFHADEVFLCLYENLFSEETHASLCSFLEREKDLEAIRKVVNASSGRINIPQSLAKEIAVFYSEQYESVFKIFPNAQALWPNSSLL